MTDALPPVLAVLAALVWFSTATSTGAKVIDWSFWSLASAAAGSVVSLALPGQQQASAIIFGGVAIGAAIAHGAIHPAERASRSAQASALMFSTVGVILFASNLQVGGSGFIETLGRLLLPAYLITLAWLASRGQLRADAILVSIVTAQLVSLWFVALSSNPWQQCSVFKCGPFGQLLVGPFVSENTLARVSCVALLAVWMLKPPTRVLLLQLLLCSVVLAATNSRTHLLALLVAMIAALLVPTRPQDRRSIRPAMVWIVLLLLCVTGPLLVYEAAPDAFSNRGTIWALGTEALGANWGWGLGIDSWSSTVLDRNFMHSQSLLLLYSGGILSLIVYFYALALLTRSAGLADRRGVFAAVAFALVVGLTEIYWNPLGFDQGVMSILLILGAAARRRSPLVDESAPSAASALRRF